jgi:hypothetical protein
VHCVTLELVQALHVRSRQLEAERGSLYSYSSIGIRAWKEYLVGSGLEIIPRSLLVAIRYRNDRDSRGWSVTNCNCWLPCSTTVPVVAITDIRVGPVVIVVVDSVPMIVHNMTSRLNLGLINVVRSLMSVRGMGWLIVPMSCDKK